MNASEDAVMTSKVAEMKHVMDEVAQGFAHMQLASAKVDTVASLSPSKDGDGDIGLMAWSPLLMRMQIFVDLVDGVAEVRIHVHSGTALYNLLP